VDFSCLFCIMLIILFNTTFVYNSAELRMISLMPLFYFYPDTVMLFDSKCSHRPRLRSVGGGWEQDFV